MSNFEENSGKPQKNVIFELNLLAQNVGGVAYEVRIPLVEVFVCSRLEKACLFLPASVLKMLKTVAVAEGEHYLVNDGSYPKFHRIGLVARFGYWVALPYPPLQSGNVGTFGGAHRACCAGARF
mmetsp:Transcript_23682/g.46371  ORF Transcript_23682/g.46371 Transcript_23682/m.46371 type:complete len:124 (+) Transcript_23682:1427-1798(+)